MSFDTGYVGAHRWHVEEDDHYPRGCQFKWACVCGDTGNVASSRSNRDFVLDAFARHAHDKLEEAAVSLLVDWMPSSLPTSTIQAVIGQLRTQGANDKANLLQLVVNHRYHADQS